MITLSYIGVHQIFQLALAAQESDQLESLHCSLIDRPGKWGHRLARGSPPPSLRPLGYLELRPDRVFEHPLPLLIHRLTQRLWPQKQSDQLFTNQLFDRIVARHIAKSATSGIFVGAETCALESMRAAKKKGMHCILDCPGVPVLYLDAQARIAAKGLDLQLPSSSNSPAMLARKRQELELADLILCCSAFQAEKVSEQGIDPGRIRVVPLWADAEFWSGLYPVRSNRSLPSEGRPLRIIYAGTLSLKKGIPYLLQALRRLPVPFECLLVGRISPEMAPFLSDLPGGCRIESYVPKDRLRQLYSEHDVLVMPSLGDSFGFVGMEAMAAGLPVIASSNAGVPLPSPDWRIPARDAEALARRLMHYATHRDALADDSAQAAAFARQFTPQRYRDQIKDIYQELRPSSASR
jgi:glycosyltransferase involved in cell wall biosynthesis